jgi:hypothetical protein
MPLLQLPGRGITLKPDLVPEAKKEGATLA